MITLGPELQKLASLLELIDGVEILVKFHH